MPTLETPDPKSGESFEAKEAKLAENLPASAATIEELQTVLSQSTNSHRALDPDADVQFKVGDTHYYVETEGLSESVKASVQTLTPGPNGTLEQIYLLQSTEGVDTLTKRLGLVDPSEDKPLRLSAQDRRAETEYGLTQVSEAEAKQLIETIRLHGGAVRTR